jgi:hypothetical protein
MNDPVQSETFMSERCYRIVIREVGQRPPFGEVVNHLYGVGSNIDTDGDSYTPNATDWTWLYMRDRATVNAPVVEAVLSEDRDGEMIVASADLRLARSAADFLAMRSGGKIETAL